MRCLKILFSFTWILFLPISDLLAVDLVVRENGVLPEYATISAAVTAASNGDRILIFNKSGNVPYTENVTIDKSLSFLPATCPLAGNDSCFFYVDGDWTFTYAASGGRQITIIGMRNLTGQIINNGSSSVGAPNVLNVHGCWLDFGGITNSGTNTISNITNNYIPNAGISCRYGFVAGNSLGGNITISDGELFSIVSDTLFVICNRLTGTNSRISWDNDEQICYLANNYVSGSNFVGGLIDIVNHDAANLNYIYNNTLVLNAVNNIVQIGIDLNDKLNFEIQNNVIYSLGTDDLGIRAGINSGPSVNIAYNLISGLNDPISGIGYMASDNDTTSTVTLDPLSGNCTSAACIHGGNPGPAFYDFDLTPNDLGTYGGSYNPENYFPLFQGGARIFFLNIPRTGIQNAAIRAEAEAFDR